MAKHLQRAINQLMEQLIALGAKVESSVKRSVQSLEESDIPLAEQVIREDSEIDKRELDIEEECLKIFALHQPVAVDLRYLVAVLKINNDMERIGDLAQNIAGHTLRILRASALVKPSQLDVTPIYHKVQVMLKKSIDAIVNLDVKTAGEIMKADDEVDRLHREYAQRVVEEIRTHPDKAEVLIQYIHVARHLERIADHTTNIAEDVIYLIEGEIVRHSAFAKNRD